MADSHPDLSALPGYGSSTSTEKRQQSVPKLSITKLDEHDATRMSGGSPTWPPMGLRVPGQLERNNSVMSVTSTLYSSNASIHDAEPRRVSHGQDWNEQD